MRLRERVVDRFHDLAGGDVHQQQVRSVAHPLESRRRRIEAKTSPVGIVVSRRQEERRQDRAGRPAPVFPAARIDERREMDAIERAAVPAELVSRNRQTAGTRPSGPGMRAAEAGAWSGMRLNKRLCAALRSANPRRRFSAAARWFTAAPDDAADCSLATRQASAPRAPTPRQWQLCATFRPLVFFNLRSTRRGQHYQSPCGSVTRHARWKVDT